ncbi:hypothetical protein ACFQL0_02500 [Haloplanus litoreus]|uniref:hypothetical protein n=1 Tax=Haloplanus litoreus TaxID=767515 RepID=UPI00360BEC1A
MGSGSESRPRRSATGAGVGTTRGPTPAGRDRVGQDPRELAAFVLVALAIVGAAAIVVGPAGDTTTTDTGAGGAAGTATPESVATTATATTTTTADSAPDVAMRVRSIETCGTRCRTVTIGLTNRGDDPAQSVRVATEITTGGSLVWEGRSDVGSLAAGETVTRTRTIRIGYVDAARIERNDGRIRIETTVRTASGTRTFTERRTVS